MHADHHWMQRALELAERGRGAVEPNPLVGAVVVRDGAVVGEGYHECFGGPHAEIHALAAAGERARGATLYVTLEPCCHHGKTPPCTDAIRRAGIARVVAAMSDPFPAVGGKGIAELERHGVICTVGVCERESARQNAPFLTLIHERRPYVHAKWAMSLDGKLATRTGDSKWISCEESRRRVHELRGRMDAIIVGAGTVRADDPLLTARPPGPRVPTRIVLTSDGRLPAHCRLLQSRDLAPLLVAGPEGFRGHEGDILRVPAVQGRLSIAALLAELGRRQMTNVLVEGGPRVLDSFFDVGLIDEVHVFVASIVIGKAAKMSEAIRVKCDSIRSGEDWLIHGRLNEPPQERDAPR
jgi:diaminohydroxyphosphoribosylaminopyrimidine deaminase/5-amino-6-(5-phosphoribosylamino)uracil reductase